MDTMTTGRASTSRAPGTPSVVAAGTARRVVAYAQPFEKSAPTTRKKMRWIPPPTVGRECTSTASRVALPPHRTAYALVEEAGKSANTTVTHADSLSTYRSAVPSTAARRSTFAQWPAVARALPTRSRLGVVRGKGNAHRGYCTAWPPHPRR